MKNSFLLFWLLVWMPVRSCTENFYLERIRFYLNASSTFDKSKYLADNFHSFFMNKNSNAKNKTEALASFQNWDGPLHPDVKIITYTFHDSVWEVTFNEQNDFSKPLGFPGWKGTTTFVFNKAGLIKESVYVPDSTNLSYKPFLQPALNWLQKNRVQALMDVYKNGKLIQTEIAAIKWSMLLQQWQLKKQ